MPPHAAPRVHRELPIAKAAESALLHRELPEVSLCIQIIEAPLDRYRVAPYSRFLLGAWLFLRAVIVLVLRDPLRVLCLLAFDVLLLLAPAPYGWILSLTVALLAAGWTVWRAAALTRAALGKAPAVGRHL